MKKVLALLPALFLIGCIDINQSISINEDGTASYKMEMAMDAKLAAMGGKSDPDEMCGNMYQKQLPEELTAVSNAYYSQGNMICAMTITGPVDKFSEALVASSQKKSKGNFLKVTPQGDDVYRIESVFTSEANESNQNASAKQMAAAMLAGRAIRWDIAADEIIGTNGQISDDRKSVHWELPMAVVMEEGEHKFWADVKIHVSWFDKLMSMFS